MGQAWRSRGGFISGGKLLLLLLVVAVIGGWIGSRSMVGIEFDAHATEKFLSRLSVFFLVALLIERTVEVFLTIWRGGESVKMQAAVDRQKELEAAKIRRDTRRAELTKEIQSLEAQLATSKTATGDAAKEAVLRDEKKLGELRLEHAGLASEVPPNETEKQLIEYKNRTRDIAMTFSFALAFLVAVSGFRALDGLVILSPSTTGTSGPTNRVDPGRLKEFTEAAMARLKTDREEVEKLSTADSRGILRNQQDTALRKWFEDELGRRMATWNPPAESQGAESSIRPLPSESQIRLFRVFDMLLTAGLLAGGADPISRVMKLFRDFLDQSNKQVREKDKPESPPGKAT